MEHVDEERHMEHVDEERHMEHVDEERHMEHVDKERHMELNLLGKNGQNHFNVFLTSFL